MRIAIRPSGAPERAVPATLLGQNMEICIGVGPGLTADRLENPKFRGPADPVTGIAYRWAPGMNHNYMGGAHFELTPGMSMSGNESQMIHNYTGRGKGILQIGRQIRAGERLEVVVWARSQNRPTRLQVGLRPLDAGKPGYAEAEITVTRTYWAEYRAVLTVPKDDNAAVFYVMVPDVGMVWLDQVHLWPEGTGPIRRDVQEAFRPLGIPALRFPGGCISTNYHWKHGTGPISTRPVLYDPVFKFEMNYEFGTDEYLALCVEQGITPQISVNIGTGTPAEAGEWAAYVANWFRSRGIDPPEMYWQMGNEHYGAWEIGSMSGEMYADALREFVPAVRANYPKARIIALGVESGELRMAGESAPWRAAVLEKAADLVDLLAIQYYCGGWDDDPAARQAKVMQSEMGIPATLRKAIEDIKAAGKDITVAMTEWNMWQMASHHDNRDFLEAYDVQHGQFVASVLNDYTALAPELELANFYNLFNVMGAFLAHGPEIVATPLVDVFTLYRPAFPGTAVDLAVESPTLDGAESAPAVTAACLRNDEGTWLFVVNRSVNEEANIELDGLGIAGITDLLIGTDLQGNFTHDVVCNSGPALTVPPMSIARVMVG
jgi:alpha-N-arabinofuranosidase